MANTYNYNGEMLRPSAILKHYPNISIATMRNWLRSCDAISDVKEQLDTRYQKLYATGIKSKAEQLYVYNGKLSFTRSIAEEIGVATPTVYEWLKPYKAYTDITQVITAKLWCRDAVNQTKMGSLLKLYDGTFMLPDTAYKLFRVTNVNLNTIGVLNTLWCAHKQGAEIHHIFDSLYEFTCPECERKLLLTSDEIFSFKHSSEFCVGKEII